MTTQPVRYVPGVGIATSQYVNHREQVSQAMEGVSCRMLSLAIAPSRDSLLYPSQLQLLQSVVCNVKAK